MNVKTNRICQKHWPNDAPMVKVQRGGSLPKLHPNLFDAPFSSLPTPKPPPRMKKKEFALQDHFDKNDKFGSYETFFPSSQKNREIKTEVA